MNKINISKHSKKTVTVSINTCTNENISFSDIYSLKEELNKIKKIKVLNVRINSYGGDINVYLYLAGHLLELSAAKNFEIKTYADPNVFSAAILVWLCADKHNRNIDKTVGQLIFHPIKYNCDDAIECAIGKYVKNQAYKFVKERTGIHMDTIADMYENENGYLHIDSKNAYRWNLL